MKNNKGEIKVKLLKLECKECGTVFIADNMRHHVDYCPGCQESWIDLEKHYCRHNGKIKNLGYFESPWFDTEEEYHSALMGWLQDSDEEYILEKDYRTEILTIIRL